MLFKEWFVNQFDSKDNEMGDLALDIKHDSKFPETSDHSILEEYIISRRADSEIIKIFNKAYKLYAAR